MITRKIVPFLMSRNTAPFSGVKNPKKYNILVSFLLFSKNAIFLPNIPDNYDFPRTKIFNRSANREISYRIFLFLNPKTPYKCYILMSFSKNAIFSKKTLIILIFFAPTHFRAASRPAASKWASKIATFFNLIT